ncbi:MAG: bifunctional glutamate N-acetyltransferase/amino-acid acetyltransferase ArgJ [Nitrospinaceae bacterium]|jgi:glutamate N-acetyltransferase / amino-acid N-acetyltransferase|nr:bifunctional glutamate N-acetyltransferase/amino-acid acetyltransferase ArgJ [Nitrospinaceae bacterium]MBT5369999.1 bifunctional glutamate N-acetyltransferase/amino-acid acetyltransferase ArgJ [Nitrospinaceae bacterium]MBT7855442.1 bifunctional glutamate N-acetyltransferase/amino-acid acetyltransferase ArgJ [Nitrospinaceae bacterium]
MSEKINIQVIEGGVCAAEGVRASAATAGIKESGNPDITLIAFDPPAEAAGVYTRNLVCAAPVVLCRERVGKGPLRAILVNSGNANACTGQTGLSDAYHLCDGIAGVLGSKSDEVVMSSTGLIGANLPVELLEAKFGELVAGLSKGGGTASAEAIMTTDTRPKEYAVSVELPEGTVRIGGMSKGAGMIAPNMATMLAYVTTDAAVSSELLAKLLREASDMSFNCVTIDGDTSTNDTAILAATGASGVRVESGETLELFETALKQVCLELALAIVRDGEGVTKVVQLRVEGATSDEDARLAARSVSESLLVKTAINGNLPNWGRIFAAAGYSGAALDQERLYLKFDDIEVARDGAPIGGQDDSLRKVLEKPEYTVTLGLGVGDASSNFWTTDLSREYVTINADYRT